MSRKKTRGKNGNGSSNGVLLGPGGELRVARGVATLQVSRVHSCSAELVLDGNPLMSVIFGAGRDRNRESPRDQVFPVPHGGEIQVIDRGQNGHTIVLGTYRVFVEGPSARLSPLH